MKKIYFFIVMLFAISAVFGQTQQPQSAFTPGNLVIYRVGDGAAALGATATAGFLDEYTTTGTLVQSIPLPTTVSGSNKRITNSGSATSECLLTRSTDKQYLLATGYDAALGTAAVAGTTSASVNRVVGRVAYDGTIDATTALSDFSTGSNPRSAMSSNGIDIWVTGGAGGIRYTTFGSTTSTQISVTATNLRQANIFAGQLYTSTASGALRLSTVGTGLPTTTGQTITNLPGFPTATGSPYSYFFADLDAGVAGNDVVYVADDGSGTGFQKYSLVSGSWVANGNIAVTGNGLRGLVATVTGTTVTFYGTNGTSLVTLTDATGYNATISGTVVSLAAAGTNKAFRGIAFAPEQLLAPSLIATPSSLSGFITNVGTPSSSQSYSLSGTNLTGAPGNILVTAPAGFEVSTDNSIFTGSVNVAYSTSALSATAVYVRLIGASGGAVSGTVTNVGGGASAGVSVSGNVVQTFYSKSSGSLASTTTWGIATDGTGTNPPDFTSGFAIFTVTNRISETLDANWTVSGTSSKVVTGDGAGATELIIPSGFTLTGTVDVANLGTLTLQTTTLPTLGTFANGSMVNFAQASALVVPAGTYYHLKLTNSTKTLATGITTINGNFVIDGVTGFNGGGTPFSTVNLAGDFTLQNAAAFDPNPAGDGNRLTLILTGSGTQSLTGGDFQLFRLQTPAAPATTLNILLNSANLLLGNASSGGLMLQQSTHTLSLNGGSLTIRASGFFSATNTGTITGTTSSSIFINKTTGSTAIGSVGFTAGGQVLGVFSLISSGTGSNNLTLNSPLRVMNGFGLGAGNLITTSTNLLTLDANCIPSGASATAFVSGPMIMETNSLNSYTFPVGKGGSYRPLDVIPSTPAASSYTAEYFNNAYTDFTLCNANLDAVDNNEYWDIARNSGSGAQIRLNYNATNTWSNAGSPDATKAIVVAHYVAGCWKEETGTFLPGTSGPAPVTSKTLATFSPFLFGFGPLGILPANFDNIKAYQQAGGIKIEWSNLTETDVLNYTVERSADGRIFAAIGSVNARLNNGSRADYNFLDLSPINAVNYYRINAKGINGSDKYSIVVKVDIKAGQPGITIYPDPVSGGQFSLQTTGLNKGQYTIRIFNANGQQVFNQLLNHNGGSATEVMQLPAALKSGMYNLQLSGGEVKLAKPFIIK